MSDTGCGIDPASTEAIFDRLAQVKTSIEASRSGLGLGLSTCRQIVELHGGEIWAELPEDGGTRFVLRLPIE